MKPVEFALRTEVDKQTGTVLAVYFQIRKGKAAKVVEIAKGNAFANYATSGELLGIELLGPCEVKILDRITSKEPNVRKFVRGAMPRDMALV